MYNVRCCLPSLVAVHNAIPVLLFVRSFDDRKAQVASTSVSVLSGMDRLAAEAGNGAGGGGGPAATGSSSTGGTATKFFKALGFGTSKQGDSNEYTHMRSVKSFVFNGGDKSPHSLVKTTLKLMVLGD